MIAIMCYYPLNMPLTSQNDSAKCLDLTAFSSTVLVRQISFKPRGAAVYRDLLVLLIPIFFPLHDGDGGGLGNRKRG
jgi:hypothetical protein